MNKNAKILLTGAAGFIGSYFLGYLNKKGYKNIIIADDFSDEDKWFNFDSKEYSAKVERDDLFIWLENNDPGIEMVFHLGARTDTTEFDYAVLEKLNLQYSKDIWNYCTKKNIPLIYASSAATYGGGEMGYKDDHDLIGQLHPMNAYGVSKNEFDKWVLSQWAVGSGQSAPPNWAGLKFFNVYGPNEYHKGRMASMVFHGYNQVKKTGIVKLFRSHNPSYKDGEQLRDFIYVEDVAKVMFWMMNEKVSPGLYNVGTGKASSFIQLVTPVFISMGLKPDIEFIDTPEDIRDKYQYFTEADMTKLREAGYKEEFKTVESGVSEYIKNYLSRNNYY